MLTTRAKLTIAGRLYQVVRTARRLVGRPGSEVICRRRGVRWALDISEGVQLGIYLGTYEAGAGRLLRHLVSPGSVVVDIGANVGAHALPLAAAVGPSGRVVAVEPSRAAFDRLRGNVALNPGLADRVTAVHAALGAPGGIVEERYFSGWPLTPGGERHPVHGGVGAPAGGAAFMTLDGLAASLGLDAIDLVKLDVDGHELPIVAGATAVVERLRPTVVFEFCPYLIEERGEAPESLPGFFTSRGYDLLDDHLRPVGDLRRLVASVPHGAGINLVARPRR
ncbi:MAG: FkbM family methyltransferase [Vicinamibacterales bacterium]